jgi:hypothetical protein
MRGPVPAPGTPWPETIAARRAVDELLRSWDDQAADRICTPNVAQDEPYATRREKAALTWQRLGPPAGGTGSSTGRPAESDSPAQLRWWLHGERGDAAVEIKLTPEDLGWPALAAHPGHHFSAERQCPRLARRPPGGCADRHRRAGSPAADRRGLGGSVPGSGVQ